MSHPSDEGHATENVATVPQPRAEERERVVIDVTDEPTGVTEVTRALQSGAIAEVYLRGRRPVWIGDGDDGPFIEEITKDALTLALHEHADVFKMRKNGPAAVLLPTRVAAVVLARNNWKLPRLKGITTVPLLSPDGQLHLREGYNPATGWFYAPQIRIKDVPETPTQEQISDAQELVVGRMLGDFPWMASSDLAQFVGALFIPLLRSMIPDPTPLWCITATNPGSGKSLLSRIMGDLFGIKTASWGSDNGEQRKVITSVLMESGHPVTVFDNVPSGHTLRYPVMSELITSQIWGDRVLGKSEMANIPNNMLWVANGNNLTVGDDLARRTIWVRLNPEVRPDTRDPSAFAAGDLNEWLQLHTAEVLHALLTLLRGWVSAGMPKSDHHMASFGAWPRTLGGILNWMCLPGWLADREAQMEDADEDSMEWAAFLSVWHDELGTKEYTSQNLVDFAFASATGMSAASTISSVMPTNGDKIPNSKQLGKWLRARQGRFFSGYRILARRDARQKINYWRVEGPKNPPQQ
ncbi:hypothetical protein [Streptomyces sp. CB02115]|uniref:hypothetical protein n=1 Tax=Streptomyces sp. CB02115 TaxID=1703939 RepID=UPI00093A5AAB|nr:hypothetical protein [Streptomyces sp. CB02115]OKJ46771.1 hypothetical protein AMK28_37605 [Streptomyces sp. CB02115]